MVINSGFKKKACLSQQFTMDTIDIAKKKKRKKFELEKNVIELFLQSQSKLRILLIN